MKLSDAVCKFAGAPGEDVDQWLDRFEVAVDLTEEITKSKNDPSGAKARLKKMALLVPLFLTGPAYITWKQVSAAEKDNWDAVSKALRRVFGKSKTSAWKELKALKLLPGEQIDVLVNQTKTLLEITAGGNTVPDQLVAAFVLDSLPSRIAEQVRLQYGEQMLLKNIVSGAKALLVTFEDYHETAAAGKVTPRTPERSDRCYECGLPNHLAKDCLLRRNASANNIQAARRNIRCFRCGDRGHVASTCRGNDDGGKASAPVSSPTGQH